MTLYDRNMAFFARRHPDVYAKLQTLSAGDTQRVQREDGSFDVLRYGVSYGVEATTLHRLYPLPAQSRQGREFVKRLREILPFETFPLSEPISDGRGYHLAVIGIGLGQFLKNVLEQAQCHHLLLLEQTPERLYHSLHILDWEDTLGVLPPDYVLTLLFGGDSVGPNTILQTLRDANPLATDGVIILSPSEDSLIQRMGQNISLLVDGWMYVDERIRSLRNSFINAHQAGVRLWQPSEIRRDTPVMIVGSGPSADSLLEDMRRLAPSCLVVAAGTGAHSLLKAGITPDIIVVIGNDRGYFSDYHTCVTTWPQVRSIPLLLSEAADLRFFDVAEQIALFGHANNPLQPLLSSHLPDMVAPTVTNAALSLMAEVGYENFLFFGLDMGAKDLSHRYSSAYPRLGRGDDRAPMPIEVRGNLGGKVFSSSLLDGARRAFENYLAWRDHDKKPLWIRNCGDGARIAGTHPTLARKLELPELPFPKQNEIAELWQSFPPLDPEDLQRTWVLSSLLAEISTLRDNLRAVLTEPPHDCFVLADRLRDVVAGTVGTSVILLIMQGVVVELVSTLLHVLGRQTASTRAAVLPQASVLLLQVFDDCCDRIVMALTDLDQGKTEGSWLVSQSE